MKMTKEQCQLAEIAASLELSQPQTSRLIRKITKKLKEWLCDS